jgi:hypothetical protein
MRRKMKSVMLRVISWFGFGGIFLAISPNLRQTVYGALDSGVTGMETYAPFSYVGAGLMLLLLMGVSLYRGAQPR